MIKYLNRFPFALTLACLGCSDPRDSVAFPGDETFDLECPGITPHVANVPEFLVIGHRGADALAVENTLDAMRAGVDAGANAVEVDLSLTKDGYVVLWHDWDPDNAIAIGRQSGAELSTKYRPVVPDVGDEWRRPADELTLDELRQHYGYAEIQSGERATATIPTFDDFIKWAADEPRLLYVLLDIKAPEDKAGLAAELVQKTMDILEVRRPEVIAVYLSPYPSVWSALDWTARSENVAFDVDPGAVTKNDQSCSDSSSRWASVRGGGYATSVKPTSWGNEDWKALKTLATCDLDARDAQGSVVRKVFAGTINDKEMTECLIDMGMDGLMADDPGKLRDIVSEKRLGSSTHSWRTP